MATIILAGGASARMGRDKACLEMDGSTVLCALVARFAGEFGPVIVVARRGQDLDVGDAVVVHDSYEGMGPLGGLHAGLTASSDAENFVLACDMPFAEPEVARHLISRLGTHDAVVPALRAGLEPLHAAYRKSCLPAIGANLDAGILRMRDMLDQVDTLFLSEDDLVPLDPDLCSFVNINTPEAYQEALRRNSSDGKPGSR